MSHFSVHAQPKGSGSITAVKTKDIDWLHSRVRVWYNDVPLITAIPSIPSEQYTAKDVSFQVDLYDKTSTLINDNFGGVYSVAAGTNIINKVIELTGAFVEPSSLTLANSMTFEPNTPKLAIVNALLDAANYWSLSCDGMGNFVSSPYVAPEHRPAVYDFVDNERGMYLPTFNRNYDPYSVPNKVICVGKTDGPAAVVKTAQDETYPLGYPHRPWHTLTYTDVEYSTADNLQAIANRKLNEAQQVLETFEVTHPYLGFGLNDVVTFTNKDMTRRAVVQKQTYNLRVGGLIVSTLRTLK